MKFSVQVDSLELLKEASATNCDKVRFGAEFCEWKIPSLQTLKEAYAIAEDAGKEFDYVTPRCSDRALRKITDQLAFLNGKKESQIIVNDLGLLSVVNGYNGLRSHLGRQLVHIPARCPWFKRDTRGLVFFGYLVKGAMLRRHVRDIYRETSLHYGPTVKFYQELGVRGVDLDWVPNCFPQFKFLVDAGLDLSVHTHFVPVAITRKCHTARFLGERAPETCSKPCDTRAFFLEHKGVFMTVELLLQGNAVFSFAEPTEKDVRSLLEIGVSELIVSMNPATGMLSRQKVDEAVSSIKSMGGIK